MKSKLILLVICILLLIVDNTFAPFINILGAYPSFLFVFVISYSIIVGKKDAVYLGVISGLLQDIFFINGMGVNALINMLLCLLAASIGEGIFKNRKLIPLLVCGLVSILKVIYIVIVFAFLGLHTKIEVPIISTIYNIVIMFFGYKYVLKLSKVNFMKNDWRFR